jgi:hypothetical protein
MSNSETFENFKRRRANERLKKEANKPMTWGLARNAFTQATKNALPKNVVNKIFTYKEASNYLRNRFKSIKTNEQVSAYTRFLVNSKPKINTSQKLEIIEKMITYLGAKGPKYINLINSLDKVIELRDYTHLSERHYNLREFNSVNYARRFLKQNQPVREKVLNIMSGRDPKAKEIIALMGTRQEILKMLKNYLNEDILRTRLELHSINKALRASQNKPSTRKRKMLYDKYNTEFKNMVKRLRTAEKQKNNLDSLTTATLRNKIKSLEL